MAETALVISNTEGTAPTVPVRHAVSETDAVILVFRSRFLTNEPADLISGAEASEWQPTEVYEATLAQLTAENDAREGMTWAPDTPEQAADRRETTEALLDEQPAVLTRDDS